MGTHISRSRLSGVVVASGAMRAALALLAALTLAAAGWIATGPDSHPSTARPHSPGWARQGPPQGLKLAAPQPTGEMFDTITVATVPANPFAVAGYTSGFWPTFGPLVAAFPHARHISIAIYGTHAADCLDVEPGDAPPSMVPGWVRWMLNLGHWKPCLYSSVSWFADYVNPILSQAGLSGSVRRWCAWYRYVGGLISGCDAVQWTDHALGRNLDESTVSLATFFRQAPKPKPVRCFGPRHSHAKVCAVKRANVARWSRAVIATRQALNHSNCYRHRDHRRAPQPCRVLFARGDWLHAQIALALK